MHQALFRIETPYAPVMYEAISPENEEEYGGRTHTRCSLPEAHVLELSLEASDLSALRAALNTWLRLIQVASEMIERTQIYKR